MLKKISEKTVMPLILILLCFLLITCKTKKQDYPESVYVENEPLIENMYTADPSAHVFDGKLYIYPSHDLENDVPDDGMGAQFDMKDYHVFSLDEIGGTVTDHGEILNVDSVPWAEKQFWAPDAAFKNNAYYFYFPAKDKDGLFRIGAAVSDSPAGPFKPQAEPIPGSFSMDPCVFVDDDGTAYMYFGGLSGGQLEKWQTGTYDPKGMIPADTRPALSPKVVKMADNMLEFDGQIMDAKIVFEDGSPVLQGDKGMMFFEGAWMHKYKGKYYLSYSTGYFRHIAYAIADNPLGPFVFKGYVLKPVEGWTNHHSIVEYKKKWYLFYHDSIKSKGVLYLRNVKMTELMFRDDGTIVTVEPARL